MYAMSPETEAKILHKLDELEPREGEGRKLVQLYRQLLRLQSKARSQFSTPKLNLGTDVISNRLTKGLPLLSFDDLALDWAQVQRLFREISRLVAHNSTESAKAAKNLGTISSDMTFLEEAARAWYQGVSLTSIAVRYNVDAELLGLIVAAVLKPILSAHSEVLLPKIEQESWRHRYCPICGGRPDFAYLDKETGARWLLCSRCDTKWLFQRLECPYCGCQDQDALAYFTDDIGLYRLYVCEQCKRYLKTIDLRRTESEVLLPLERLLTFELDIQARADGYNPCAEANTN